MQFKAQVAFNESAETLKRREETREAKALLFKALDLISHEDDSILREAEEYLKGSRA